MSHFSKLKVHQNVFIKKKKRIQLQMEKCFKITRIHQIVDNVFLVFIDKPVQYEIQFWILQKIIDETIEKLLKKKKMHGSQNFEYLKYLFYFYFFFCFSNLVV